MRKGASWWVQGGLGGGEQGGAYVLGSRWWCGCRCRIAQAAYCPGPRALSIAAPGASAIHRGPKHVGCRSPNQHGMRTAATA